METNPEAGLLDAPRGIRAQWAVEVGKRHRLGIALDVGVRLVPGKDEGVDYQIRGVVDVPSEPYGDDERTYLAKVLVDCADIPNSKYEYTLHSWVATKGGSGVRVEKCGPIPVFTPADIIGDITIFTPPEMEERDDVDDGMGIDKHNEWVREYGENRYCRFESREELHQRYQDIWVNTQVLTPSGKLGLTADERWYRLQQHVITEMLLRGEPPSLTNHHPDVQEAHPFFDGELCRKAASIVAVRGTEHDVLVKYGRKEYMERLMDGEVYLNSATEYNESAHNQAVRDDELVIEFKGGYAHAAQPTQFYNRERQPPDFGMADFRFIHDLPTLRSDEYATQTRRMRTDYWMFCVADVLDQRLFADFGADSCVIVARRQFADRLLRASMLQLPNVYRRLGRVGYVDPLGARETGVQATHSMPIYMTKVFRYSYQREIRFAFLPRSSKDRLEPRTLSLGPISDIAELVVL